MTEDQILELISQDDSNEVHLTVNEITQIYVKQLAVMSDQLTRDDLVAMLTIGALLYKKGYQEMRDDLEEKARLEAIIKI